MMNRIGPAVILIILLIGAFNISAKDKVVVDKKNRIIYKYKQYEKFDFENIGIDAETGSPGDLSIYERYQRKYKNKLPFRENFNPELRKSIERIH